MVNPKPTKDQPASHLVPSPEPDLDQSKVHLISALNCLSGVRARGPREPTERQEKLEIREDELRQARALPTHAPTHPHKLMETLCAYTNK